MTFRRRVSLASFAFVLVACGGGKDLGSSPSSKISASTSQSLCTLYLSCVGDSDPDSLPEALAAYGPSGTCWQTSETSTVCAQACAAGIAQSDSSCTECNTDADCVAIGNAGTQGSSGFAEGPNVNDPDESPAIAPGANAPICNAGSCVCAPQLHSCSKDDDCCSGDCESGICTCPKGTAECNGLCYDLQTNIYNCGSCGNACAVVTDGACNAGTCVGTPF
jgi:hypothetical protein